MKSKGSLNHTNNGKDPGAILRLQNFCSGVYYKVHQESLVSGWESIIGMKCACSPKNPEIEGLKCPNKEKLIPIQFNPLVFSYKIVRDSGTPPLLILSRTLELGTEEAVPQTLFKVFSLV